MTEFTPEQPVAWLRDAHEGKGDECLVPAAKGDPGAFPVYAEPPSYKERGEELERALGALRKIGNRDFVVEPGRGDDGKDRTRCPCCGYAWDYGRREQHSRDCALIIARAALQSKGGE